MLKRNKNKIQLIMSETDLQLFVATGKLISISQAAHLTPYSPEYLSLLARTGKLKAIKIGRNWVTTKGAVFEYLKLQQHKYEAKAKVLALAERGGV